MQRPCLIAFCVLLMLMLSVAGSGFVFSQELRDARITFDHGYLDEFGQTEEQKRKQMEFFQLTDQLRRESYQTVSENTSKYMEARIKALGRDFTIEESFQIPQDAHVEASFDAEYAMYQKLAEKEKEMFPDAQKRQQRQFQLQEGMMMRLDSFGDPQDIMSIQGGSSVARSFAQPDFLELTQEQKDLIKKIQKDTTLKFSRIRIKAMEQSEKQNELVQLMQTLSSGGDRNEITRKMVQLEMDMLKDAIPELKAILIEGRESYMRVLTDTQKAKIKSVMDDMPDYMKNLFAAIDKQGGGLSILHNWQPGVGVPDYPNPNRELPRERTNTGGGRAFGE